MSSLEFLVTSSSMLAHLDLLRTGSEAFLRQHEAVRTLKTNPRDMDGWAWLLLRLIHDGNVGWSRAEHMKSTTLKLVRAIVLRRLSWGGGIIDTAALHCGMHWMVGV